MARPPGWGQIKKPPGRIAPTEGHSVPPPFLENSYGHFSVLSPVGPLARTVDLTPSIGLSGVFGMLLLDVLCRTLLISASVTPIWRAASFTDHL